MTRAIYIINMPEQMCRVPEIKKVWRKEVLGAVVVFYVIRALTFGQKPYLKFNCLLILIFKYV